MFQLLLDGVNIHDPASTQALQCEVGHHCDLNFISVTPPWILVLLMPTLWLPFTTAANVWSLTQIALALIAAFLVDHRFRSTGRTGLWAVFTVLTSFGLIHTLYYGQLGGLLLLGAAIVYHTRTTRARPWLEGFGLLLLTIKPHLWVILGMAILFDDLKHGRFAVIGWLGIWLGGCLFIMELLAPGANLAWALHTSQIKPLAGVVPSGEWLNGSAAFALRWWPQAELTEAVRPMALSFVPLLLAVLGVAYWIWWGPPIDWQQDVIVIIALSILVAPFSWPCDLVVLSLLAVDRLLRLRPAYRPWLFLALVGYQILAFRAYWLSEFFDALLFWYGLGYIPLLWITRRPEPNQTHLDVAQAKPSMRRQEAEA